MKKLGLYSAAFILSMLIAACSGNDDPLPSKNEGDSSSKPSAVLSGQQEKTTVKGKLTLLATNNLTNLGLPHGSYSGITMIGENKYAIVDDHALYGGIFTLDFKLNDKGEISEKKLNRVQLDGTSFSKGENYGGDENWYDPEGIIYHKSTDSYFVCQERYQEIFEYDKNGKHTGRKINVPEEFNYAVIQEAFGFESLAYNANTGLFWTTTEKSLLKDKTEANNQHKLRLQSFGEDLNPGKQVFYNTDTFNKNAYLHGVSDILALDDGRLIVIEREVEVYSESLAEVGVNFISPLKYNTKTKLYLIDPTNVKDGETVEKNLLTEFKTEVDAISSPSLADYEGICLGPKLNGKQTVLLLADTQNGMGGSMGSITITMQEYLKVFILE